MGGNKSIGKLFTVLCLALLVQVRGVPAAADDAITIYPGTQYQTLEGWGAALSWWTNQVGGWAEPIRTQLVDLIFAAPQPV